MKNLKLITSIVFMALFSFVSCQDEIDNESGENPNTNTADSQTADNLIRTSMYDGSFDDFLDGVSCSSILLPVTATVNGTTLTIVSQTDYEQVLNILGEFNTDDDTVVLQFPLTVALSNYTEVVVTNQAEYDALVDACETAEAEGEAAISCLDIEFPITILTYSLTLEQTGSVVLESEQQLYAYMNDFSNDELFSINYPINIDFASGSSTTITSDTSLQASINDCINDEEAMEDAEEDADALEEILVDGLFQVESFVNAGINTANDYAEFTIDFANDLSIVAENTVNTAVSDVQGTYEVTSQMEVYLSLNFTGDATFSLLNHDWQVVSYSNSSIVLQSTTNTAITLVLSQV
ncbi:hypothetical protein ACFSSB_14840 [Lacinutrix gracilariae]|uniref:Uncharacterized protein n=1 Tax=Lacinutrix gracilariae TaxID=1747198 RepID=A0ABW5K3X2_9FLAO